MYVVTIPDIINIKYVLLLLLLLLLLLFSSVHPIKYGTSTVVALLH